MAPVVFSMAGPYAVEKRVHAKAIAALQIGAGQNTNLECSHKLKISRMCTVAQDRGTSSETLNQDQHIRMQRTYLNTPSGIHSARSTSRVRRSRTAFTHLIHPNPQRNHTLCTSHESLTKSTAPTYEPRALPSHRTLTRPVNGPQLPSQSFPYT